MVPCIPRPARDERAVFSERAYEIKYLDTTPLVGIVPNAAATTR
jgi:hypothetical protein